MKSKYARNGYCAISTQVDKSKSYFSTLKSIKDKRYKFYLVLGKGDVVKGYHKYSMYADELRNKMIDIYEEKGKFVFRDWLFEHKLYKTIPSSYKFVHSVIFEYEDMRINTMVKMRKVLKIYNKEMR